MSAIFLGLNALTKARADKWKATSESNRVDRQVVLSGLPLNFTRTY